MPNEISLSKKYTTRSLLKVRLYAVDGPNATYPVVGEVEGRTIPTLWTKTGGFYNSGQDELDLIESPREIQVKGWVRVYQDGSWSSYRSKDGINDYPSFAIFEINQTVKEGEGITK